MPTLEYSSWGVVKYDPADSGCHLLTGDGDEVFPSVALSICTRQRICGSWAMPSP